MKTNILAIIPARGNSKRLPNKNIKPLMGKPLIAYTIDAAQKSKYITRIVVTTDNVKISQAAKEYGAEVIKRPKIIAKDTAPVVKAIKHTVEFLKNKENYQPEIIALLQPTSPLKKPEDIDRTIKKFIDKKADSVQSFCKIKEHPYYAFKILKDKAIPLDKKNFTKRFQDLPKFYRESGAVYVFKTSLLKRNTMYGKKNYAIVMPYERSIDVDSWLDFEIAKLIIKNKKCK